MLQTIPPATRADLDRLPDNVRGEIIDGVLYTSPKARSGHQLVIGNVMTDLGAPFSRGRGGPGGWILLPEPGIELPRAPEFIPDVAGWRLERWVDPIARPIHVAPDWICEVLSPSTRRFDVLVKRPFYANIGVEWLWFVEPGVSVTVSHLVAGRWDDVAVFDHDEIARIEPFVDIEIDLKLWWRP